MIDRRELLMAGGALGFPADRSKRNYANQQYGPVLARQGSPGHLNLHADGSWRSAWERSREPIAEDRSEIPRHSGHQMVRVRVQGRLAAAIGDVRPTQGKG